ncbi:hypothetical protein HX049_14515 [Myroides odoratimimus]|uniref:hypothetical protein n=1 Tax=Myroides odoratimimus TaxID=76832 RepID=UPI0025787282|nr:hypothetical protein [Myroides odoratimimus]MDM1398370.1 hypothetical protein [Myroides odoratimimus]
MKLKISILSVILISITNCYGQSVNQLNELLNKSIEKHILEKHLEQAIFLKENVPSDFQFAKIVIDNCEVTFFDKSMYRKSELKQGIKSFRLLPIVLKYNTLSITIASVFVSKKGNNITISSSDYSTYDYRYSCEKMQWELLDIKEKGI